MAKNISSRTGSVRTGKSASAGDLKGRAEITTKSAGVKASERLAAPPLSYQSVRSGVSVDVVRDFLDQGRLRRSDVQMVIPARTFERRLSEHQKLKIDEADAIARLLRVRDHALRVFGDPDLAEEWLSLPNSELGDEIPIRMARTDVGAREVEAVLGRIEHGVFA